MFCGAGGFSTGAAAAGCRVSFACDADQDSLNTHALNHPETIHVCKELPVDDLPFPTDGRRWHLHGSPPCQKFSSVCTRRRAPGDTEKPLSLVEWFLNLALSCSCYSWSMEEVPSKHILNLVEALRLAHPKKVAYSVFNFDELGVPQTRRRLIAGSPHLLERLMRAREEVPRRSIRSVIPQPRGTHIRNGLKWIKKRKRHYKTKGAGYVYTKAEWTDGCQPVDGPAPTVVQGALWWIRVTRDGTVDRRRLNKAEYAALQCFPADYAFPEDWFSARKQIANAVPPPVAQLLLS